MMAALGRAILGAATFLGLVVFFLWLATWVPPEFGRVDWWRLVRVVGILGAILGAGVLWLVVDTLRWDAAMRRERGRQWRNG